MNWKKTAAGILALCICMTPVAMHGKAFPGVSLSASAAETTSLTYTDDSVGTITYHIDNSWYSPERHSKFPPKSTAHR